MRQQKVYLSFFIVLTLGVSTARESPLPKSDKQQLLASTAREYGKDACRHFST